MADLHLRPIGHLCRCVLVDYANDELYIFGVRTPIGQQEDNRAGLFAGDIQRHMAARGRVGELAEFDRLIVDGRYNAEVAIRLMALLGGDLEECYLLGVD
jgi:hypothetical protein